MDRTWQEEGKARDCGPVEEMLVTQGSITIESATTKGVSEVGVEEQNEEEEGEAKEEEGKRGEDEWCRIGVGRFVVAVKMVQSIGKEVVEVETEGS